MADGDGEEDTGRLRIQFELCNNKGHGEVNYEDRESVIEIRTNL